jgi:hypothetical protein
VQLQIKDSDKTSIARAEGLYKEIIAMLTSHNANMATSATDAATRTTSCGVDQPALDYVRIVSSFSTTFHGLAYLQATVKRINPDVPSAAPIQSILPRGSIGCSGGTTNQSKPKTAALIIALSPHQSYVSIFPSVTILTHYATEEAKIQ